MIRRYRRPWMEWSCPLQGSDPSNTPHRSWWYISVKMHGRPGGIKILEDCEIFVRINNEENWIRMKWQSLDSQKGESKKTFRPGDIGTIPIAVRDEDRHEDEEAIGFITDWQYLEGYTDKAPQLEGEKTYNLSFRIGNSRKTIESPDIYRLYVPRDNLGNGLFILQKEAPK